MEDKIKYCTECKSPLPMDAQFCMKCGAKQSEDPCEGSSKDQVYGMKYSEGRGLNRNAVILYMMNVRDLEVIKYYLEEKIKREKLASDRSINSLLEPGYRMYGRKPGYASGYTKNMWLYWILALLLTTVGVYAATRSFGFDAVGVIESFLKDNKKYINIAGWVIVAVGIAWMIGDLYFTIKNVKQKLAYRRECKEMRQTKWRRSGA